MKDQYDAILAALVVLYDEDCHDTVTLTLKERRWSDDAVVDVIDDIVDIKPIRKGQATLSERCWSYDAIIGVIDDIADIKPIQCKLLREYDAVFV